MKKTIVLFFTFFFLTNLNAQVIRRERQNNYQQNNNQQQYYNNNQQQQYYNNDQQQYNNPPVKERKELPPFEFKKRSMIMLSISDLVMTNFTFRYEYFTKDGKVGIQLPVSLNAGGVPDTNNYQVDNRGRFLSAHNRIFQSGLNANYYLYGQSRVSPYVGVSLAAGTFKYWINTYVPPSPTSTITPYSPAAYTHEQQVGNNVSFAFHAGFLFNPWETLTFNIKGGFGLRRYTTNYVEYTYPFGLVDLSIGFKL
ncbi:MAG: hypothetical protein ACXVC6_06050 [Bacteroidia bacterium]